MRETSPATASARPNTNSGKPIGLKRKPCSSVGKTAGEIADGLAAGRRFHGLPRDGAATAFLVADAVEGGGLQGKKSPVDNG